MAKLKNMSGLSRRFLPATQSDKRLEKIEKHLGQQSRELYVRLSHMEKRLIALEEKLSVIEKADGM
ncbi:MAG: hypothetical protein E7661_10630 [Ruminococcaceae bacterium]|nr:hypothetical protein [Oscillospiraceae bacterium]